MYPSLMSKRGIYILCHQGLGDHLLCLPIYREYAKRYKHVIVPVTQNYSSTLRSFLSDIPEIEIVPFDFAITDSRLNLKMESHAELLSCFGYEILHLGVFSPVFFKDPHMRLDENYYYQANLPLEKRWDSFSIPRSPEKEALLKSILIPNGEPYIFVHDDESRGFVLREELMPENLRIVRPDIALASRFNFSDYLSLIEEAEEIHCIESSFAAMIEGMQIQGSKYAHRYARPEALHDYRHEFTYRTSWKILY